MPVLCPSVNPRIYIYLASRLVRLLVKRDEDAPNITEENEKEYVKVYYGSICVICPFLPRSVPPSALYGWDFRKTCKKSKNFPLPKPTV